jgi:hypothetical protein
MKEAQIVAGRTGLARVARRVSFIDAPFTSEVLDEQHILMPGDFFITSFFWVKDAPDQMLEMIKILVVADSCGVCIVNKLFGELPVSVINFANDHNFPIAFINKDHPYESMLRDIFMLIIHDKEDMLIELKLNEIMGQNQNNDKVERTMYNINNHFAKYIIAIYCRCFDLEDITKILFLKNRINTVKEWLCVKFRNNILIILTFSESDEENIAVKLKYVLYQLKQISKRYVVGVSTLYKGLSQANRAIFEAITASELNIRHEQDNIVFCKNLGTYKFLLPLKDKPELLEFHDEIIIPILKYDKKYKQNLMGTAICYIDNDGDFSKTARAMCLHENSIRYRLNKIREILGFKDKKLTFYEQLFIAVKLYQILNNIEIDNNNLVPCNI